MSVFQRLTGGDTSATQAGVFSRIQQEQERQRQERLRQFNQSVPTDYRQTPLFQNVNQFTQQRQQQSQEQTRQTLSELPMRSSQLTQRIQSQVPEPQPRPTFGQSLRGTLQHAGRQLTEPLRFIQRASESLAESVIPDAPMIGRREDGSYGNLPGPTARERYLEQNPRTTVGSQGADRTADVIGNIGSYFLNPANPAQGPLALYNTPAVQNIAARVGLRSGQRTGSNLASRVGEEATREGLAAAAYAVPRSLITGESSAGEIGRNVAIEGSLGAAGGGVLAAASPMVRRAFDSIFRRSQQPASETLALPEPVRRLREGPQQGEGVIRVPETEPRALPSSDRYEAAQAIRERVRAGDRLALPESQRYRQAQQRSIQQPGTDPIQNPYTFGLPEPDQATQIRYRNVQEGRRDLSEINRSIREMESRYQQAINDQYQYLREAADIRRGGQRGGVIRDAAGNVTGRYGAVSGKPTWLREAERELGKSRLSRKDLFELAKRHVDEGFVDEGITVPSWRQRNNFDETMSALSSVRDQVQQSLRELDPAINFTDAELSVQRQRYAGERRAPEDRTIPRPESPQRPDISIDDARSQMERFNELVRANQMERPLVGRAAAPQTTPAIRRQGGVFQRIQQQPSEQPSVQRVAEETQQRATRQQSTRQQTAQQTTRQPRRRDRIVQQLDEMEQAARARIAAQRNRISSNPLDIYRDYAIIGASKMGKGLVKFADWSEDMVREFGEEIRPRLRQIYEQSREMYQRTTKQAQEAIQFAESGTGDAGTFREKIARGKETKSRSSFMESVDKIRTQLIDSAAPLERLEKNIRGKISSAEESLYKTARLFKGVPAKANEIVRTRLGPIIEQVEQAGFTPEDLGDYALAMHSRDVNRKGLMSGFTNKEIDEVIQRFGTPEMEQARQALVQLNNDMLEDLMNAQVISRDLFETLQARYPNYVPLFRHFDDDKVEFGKGLSDAMANVGSPIQRLQGSHRKVVDPLENMVRNIFHSINNAERNRVALQLAKLADEDVNNEFIRRLEPDEKVGRKNVVSVRMEGEQVQFEVQPEVYKAILGLDEESAGVLIGLLQKPASLLRAGATLTPEFSLRNPIRDIVQAYAVSNSGFNPFTDFPVALIETITKGKGVRIGNRTIGGNDLYTQFLQDNAGYGNLISMDRKVHRESLERVLKQPTGKKFVNVVSGRSLLHILRNIADVTETSVKLGEYRAALRSGASRPEAAYRARDIMDFARAGTKIRNLNKAIAFLNANIQGKSKIIRAIKENPMGVTSRAAKMVTLPTIGVFLAQKYLGNDAQQTTIRDAPTWMRNSFWLMPIPGTDQVARIPKPFDIAPLFANGPERLLEYLFENDKQAFDNFLRDSVESMSIPVMLTGIVPFVEGMANYSFFRQGPIIPQRESNIQFRDQYDLNTPATARALARAAETVTGGEGMFANFSSPRVMDNLISGLTAGLGDYANSAIDFFVKDLASGEIERPAKDVSQQPLAKAFLVNQGGSGRSMDQLYTERERLTRERGSARMRNEEFENEAQYQIINRLTTEVGNITKMIRDIEANEQLTSEQKGQAITRLNQRRNDLARRGMERYREVFGGR